MNIGCAPSPDKMTPDQTAVFDHLKDAALARGDDINNSSLMVEANRMLTEARASSMLKYKASNSATSASRLAKVMDGFINLSAETPTPMILLKVV